MVGKLPRDWFDIPAGTPVSAALGDLQCSVVSTLGTGIVYQTHSTLNIKDNLYSLTDS